MNANEKLMQTIIIGSFVVGTLLALIGSYLAFLGGEADTSLSLFGQEMTSKNAGVVSIFIGAVLIATLIRPAYKVILKTSETQDNLLTLYKEFESSKKSPHEHAAMIERIANSKNPNKKDYIMQASGLPQLSIMEGDAINLALKDIKNGKVVTDLLQRCRDIEWTKIDKMINATEDPLYKPIVTQFKYARYVARKDTPYYKKMNDFLAEATAHGYFTAKAKSLSKELEAELKNTNL
jgi:hypothetical protein